MLYQKENMKGGEILDCHDGKGKLAFTELFGAYAEVEKGFAYAHDDLLEPGASIGEHMHQGTEELYFVVEGHGFIIEDGVRREINAGEISVTRSGHSHGIINSEDSPMRLIVVCNKM